MFRKGERIIVEPLLKNTATPGPRNVTLENGYRARVVSDEHTGSIFNMFTGILSSADNGRKPVRRKRDKRKLR